APVRAGALQLDALADDADDVGALAHLLDDVLRDHAHPANSAMVTPVPPWFRAAKSNVRTRRSLPSTRRTRSRTTPVPMPWMIRRKGYSARTAASTAARVAA